jgi:hypothetical protein
MTDSPRTFILGQDDGPYRLVSATFSRMVDDADSHRLERFAGQRVRMAGAIVELHEGRPPRRRASRVREARIRWTGRLHRGAFGRQNGALADIAVNRVVGGSDWEDMAMVDASTRFLAHGGRWQPSPSRNLHMMRPTLGKPCDST